MKFMMLIDRLATASVDASADREGRTLEAIIVFKAPTITSRRVRVFRFTFADTFAIFLPLSLFAEDLKIGRQRNRRIPNISRPPDTTIMLQCHGRVRRHSGTRTST
jgi:hypothetical protein